MIWCPVEESILAEVRAQLEVCNYEFTRVARLIIHNRGLSIPQLAVICDKWILSGVSLRFFDSFGGAAVKAGRLQILKVALASHGRAKGVLATRVVGGTRFRQWRHNVRSLIVGGNCQVLCELRLSSFPLVKKLLLIRFVAFVSQFSDIWPV